MRSEEFVKTLRPSAPVLPSLRAIRPDRYSETVDRRNGQTIAVFDAADPSDFDWLERMVLEHSTTNIRACGPLVSTSISGRWPGFWRRSRRSGCSSSGARRAASSRASTTSAFGQRARDQQSGDWARERPGPFPHPPRRPADARLAVCLRCRVRTRRVRASQSQPAGCLYRAALGHRSPGSLSLLQHPGVWRRPRVWHGVPALCRGLGREVDRGHPFSRLHVDELGYPIDGHLVWADCRWWVGQFEAQGFQREAAIKPLCTRNWMATLTPGRRRAKPCSSFRSRDAGADEAYRRSEGA